MVRQTDSDHEMDAGTSVEEAGPPSGVIAGVADGTSSETRPAAVAASILELAGQLFGAEACAIWRRSPGAAEWRAVADAGMPEEFPRVISGDLMAIPETAAGLDDIRAAPELEERLSAYGRAGIRSLLAAPMILHGERSGILVFYYTVPRRFTPDELRLATSLGTLAGSALSSAELLVQREEAQSELVAALGALTRSEGRFRRLLEADLFAVVFANSTGAILDGNEALFRLTGYSREDFQSGRVRWRDLTAEEFRDRDRRAAAEMQDLGKATPYETQIIQRDGTRVPVLIAAARFEGTQDGVGVVLDLTDLKRAHEALLYAMEHAHCLLWHAWIEAPVPPAVSFYWDLRLFDEEAAQRFLPLPVDPGETYAEAYYRAKPEEDRRKTDQNARRALESGSSRYVQEYRCRRADGEMRWLAEETYLEPAGATRWRAVGICTDITQRKLLEEALRERADELAEADQRKDQFLAMLAHELRNPLGAASNALSMLEAGNATPEHRRNALAVLRRQLDHQRRLVDDLLDVSRITRGTVELKRKPVDLRALVQDAVDDCRPAALAAAIELTGEFGQRPIFVSGDATRLNQILGNLLSNSMKFTPPGGRIVVTLAEQDSSENGPRVEARISDTGSGISAELLPRIFEPFVQGDTSLDRSRGGLGLGLALARGLARRHGGDLEVLSAGPGHGATFVLTLPVLEGPVTQEEPEVRRPVSSVPRRILIVEDNRDAAETLRDLLELDGHEVHVAYAGPAALELLDAVSPEAVLCDIGLPGMDGFEVARRIREAQPHRPLLLIALTGYGTDDDRRRSLEAGFDAHLVKPLDWEALRHLLQQVS